MKVAVLGLGAMGSRMATNLAAAGFELAVWNRTAATSRPLGIGGAHWAESPGDAAGGAEVVISMVRDDIASRTVWLGPDGALGSLDSRAIGIESSTVSVRWAKELGDAFAARPVAFLDAPVLGSRAQAEAASLIHVVGGAPEVLDQARPVLSAIGGAAHHMGPPGSGAAMKLVVNAMLGLQVAALGELLGAARAWGLDERRVADVYAQTAVASSAGQTTASGMISRDFAPAFPVELIEKDLGYLLEDLAAAPLSTAVRQVFRRAINEGLGAANMTAVACLYDSQERPP